MATHVEIDGDDEIMLADIVQKTGLDATGVIRSALHEKRERLLKEQRAAFRLAELKEILRRLAPLGGSHRYMTHSEGDAWLYDENGLPH